MNDVQLVINFDAPPATCEQKPRSQSGAGRETSLQAYADTDKIGGAARIATYLRMLGAHGATRDEISVGLGMGLATVCGRCNDLLNIKPTPVIYESNLKRLTRTGSPAVVLVFGTPPSKE